VCVAKGIGVAQIHHIYESEGPTRVSARYLAKFNRRGQGVSTIPLMNHRAHLTSRRIEKPAGGSMPATDPGLFKQTMVGVPVRFSFVCISQFSVAAAISTVHRHIHISEFFPSVHLRAKLLIHMEIGFHSCIH